MIRRGGKSAHPNRTNPAATTPADLALADRIEPVHLAEAVQYQPRGTKR